MNWAKMSHWHLEEQKRVKAAIILVILVLEMLLMELPAQELDLRTLPRS